MPTESLTAFTAGVWTATGPVRILGTRLTATMSVIELGAGSLLLYSPLALTAERKLAVDTLGRVEHLYAPNLYHHSWLGEWASAYPGAKVHAPPGLSTKRPDLRIDRKHHSTPEPAFDGRIDEVRVAGFRLRETALLHRPSRTLFVADLVHNVGRPEHPWSRAYTKLMGFYDQVALSRAIRWLGFDDRTAARQSLDALLALPFDKLVVGHGTPVTSDAKQALAHAFAWLPTA